VFFPGTYTDPVNLTGASQSFFTSGIYYFESTVTISGNASVVVGEGGTEGCADDQGAVFNAVGAPASHNISGKGATFVFGGPGRLVINDSGATTGPSVFFNTRLVDNTDISALPSRGVSIISVNGVSTGATSSADLNLSGQLYVPRSMSGTSPAVDAAASGYEPSTLVPTVTPVPPSNAIVDITFNGATPAKVFIPSYIAVPQGRINIAVGPGMGAGKEVSLVGGVLAAIFSQTPDLPAVNQIGIINRVVQKTFKIVSQTTTGVPTIYSVALVQVNDFGGEPAINSWITTAVTP
jgi:hypothetical protein